MAWTLDAWEKPCAEKQTDGRDLHRLLKKEKSRPDGANVGCGRADKYEPIRLQNITSWRKNQ
jgi:hypothetical protein